MKLFFIKKIGVFLLFVALAPQATADILGVSDAALLLKAVEQLRQLQEQYNLLNDTYQNAQSQLDSINRLKEYNSGSYGHGSFNNGVDALNGWKNNAEDWRDAIENIAGGNKARYEELVSNYEKSHPMLSDDAYSRGSTPERLNQFKYRKKVNKAISVETTKTFNEINERLKNINTLALRIDETQNTKSAMDLNSRLVAELAYIAMMNLKLQTLVSQQLAENSADELMEEGELVQFNSPLNK